MVYTLLSGSRIHFVEEMWGVEIGLDFHFFETHEIAAMLRKSRFTIERIVEREPYHEVEYPSQRAYILARA